MATSVSNVLVTKESQPHGNTVGALDIPPLGFGSLWYSVH